MKFAALLLVFTMASVACAGLPAPKPLPADDIFAPYVKKVPKVAAVVSETTTDGIKVTKLRFASDQGSLDKKVQPGEYYAILARPAAAAKGKRPAILFVHGGAGFAREDAAVGWAKLGYVCLAPELVGYMDNKKSLSKNRVTGYKYGEHCTTVLPDRYACTLFDGTVSGLGAFNLLASQPDVDASRIGITGGSCGGYQVTMLAGLLDTRVKAVFNIYGSGFALKGSIWAENILPMPPAQQKVWIDNFDAATRLSRARGTYLIYAATNDHFFSQRSVVATYDAYAGPKYICWAPNSNHAILLPGGTTEKAAPLFTEMEPAFFAHVLNGNKPALPDVNAIRCPGDSKTIKFEVWHCPKDADGWVYYSPAAGMDPGAKQQKRKWEKLLAKRSPGEKGAVQFEVDMPAVDGAIDWVGGISWKLKAGGVERPISLSTPIVRREKDKLESELK